MSSDEDSDDYEYEDQRPGSSKQAGKKRADDESAVKKRKMSRACDVCRKRKVRCDFVQLPSGRLEKCLNCFSSKIECTFSEDLKPRKTSKSYVKDLEKKVERTEKLLELLCPDSQRREQLLNGDSEIPAAAESSEDLDTARALLSTLAKAVGKSPGDVTVLGLRLQMLRRYPPGHGVPLQDDFAERNTQEDVMEDEHLSQISYNNIKLEPGTEDIERFFLGKSSTRHILAHVMAMKEESRASSSRPSPMTVTTSASEGDSEVSDVEIPLNNFDIRHDDGEMNITWTAAKSFLGERRPEFWRRLPWEEKHVFRPRQVPVQPEEPFSFPDADLLEVLVENYFKYTNVEFPLLHRPTLRKGISQGLHRKNVHFGAVLLMVCAIGARFTDDPRVRMSDADLEMWYGDVEGRSREEEGHAVPASLLGLTQKARQVIANGSKGWKYFEQAWAAMDSQLYVVPPTLYDLQFYCLASIYLIGSAIPQPTWLLVGIGIRLAQDVGAHRRKWRRPYTMEYEMASQDELWKRACWVLIALDRFASLGTGRPCTLQEEDFDLDLPIECDDEYWHNADPTVQFKQPAGQPSLVSSFSLMIRLNQIMAACLRTIYALDRTKVPLMKHQIEPQIVSEIDSALNKWMDTMPEHLRWDPNQPNESYFVQSANLHASFYHLQILVHRPYIPRPNRRSTFPFPSLSICANAARSLIRIAKAQVERTSETTILMPVFLMSAGIVLLVKIWETRRMGTLTKQAFKTDMDDVNTCLSVLKSTERRMFMAGRLWDLLNELANSSPRWIGKDDGRSGSGALQSPPTQDPMDEESKKKKTTKGGSEAMRQNSSTSSACSGARLSEDFLPSPFATGAGPSKVRVVPKSTPKLFPLPTSSAGPSPRPKSLSEWGAEARGVTTNKSVSPVHSRDTDLPQWSMFTSSPRPPQQNGDVLTGGQRHHESEGSSGSSWGAVAGSLAALNPDMHVSDDFMGQHLGWGSQGVVMGDWGDATNSTLLPGFPFPGFLNDNTAVGGELVEDAFSRDSAGSVGLTGLWGDEGGGGGHAVSNDWGSYLTGVADLTSRYDLDFAFPPSLGTPPGSQQWQYPQQRPGSGGPSSDMQ